MQVDGKEVTEQIDQARSELEIEHGHREAMLQLQLDQHRKDFAKLEDEFRDALRSESKRFEATYNRYTAIDGQMSTMQKALAKSTWSERHLKTVLAEVTKMVRQQQGTINGLTTKFKAERDAHAAVDHELEAERDRATLEAGRADTLAKDAEKLLSRVAGLEKVIQGLRDERDLWSRELAAQGANLAADRGTLESTVSVLRSELAATKQTIGNLEDAVRIKGKLNDDQADSVRKLKLSLTERDRQFKAADEEFKRRIGDLEDRLEAERSLSRKLQEDLEAALDRKDGLKDEVAELKEALDGIKRDDVRSRQQATAKTEMLAQVEQEVSELRQKCQGREKELVAENTALKELVAKCERQLRQCDDAFREQIGAKNRQYDLLEAGAKQTSQGLALAQRQIATNEAEMRDLLREMEAQKRATTLKVEQLKNVMQGL